MILELFATVPSLPGHSVPDQDQRVSIVEQIGRLREDPSPTTAVAAAEEIAEIARQAGAETATVDGAPSVLVAPLERALRRRNVRPAHVLYTVDGPVLVEAADVELDPDFGSLDREIHDHLAEAGFYGAVSVGDIVRRLGA